MSPKGFINYQVYSTIMLCGHSKWAEHLAQLLTVWMPTHLNLAGAIDDSSVGWGSQPRLVWDAEERGRRDGDHGEGSERRNRHSGEAGREALPAVQRDVQRFVQYTLLVSVPPFFFRLPPARRSEEVRRDPAPPKIISSYHGLRTILYIWFFKFSPLVGNPHPFLLLDQKLLNSTDLLITIVYFL